MDLAEATQCDLPPRLRRLVGLLGQNPTRRDRRPLKHGPPTGIIVLLIGISEVYSLAAAEDSLSTTRSDRSPRRRVLLHRAKSLVPRQTARHLGCGGRVPISQSSLSS